MSNQLAKNDPIFYQKALRKLLAQAKENGVNVELLKNYIVFNDEKDGITTTVCSVVIEKVVKP